jgi:hypothetical protein
MPNPEIIGPASLAVTQGFSAFQFCLPRLADVRKANSEENPDIVGDVRLGEVAALTLTIGVGAIVSSLTGSPVPAVVSLLIGLVLVCIYEAALRGDKPMNPPTPLRSKDAIA